jgi:hypothetical protein
MRLLRFRGSPVHVSTPFRAGHQARYPASYPPTLREESRYYGLRFPAAFRPPAFASWTPLPARRDSAPITVGLPHAPRIPAHVRRTLAGFTRSACMRPGPGWALSLPRGQRCSPTIEQSAVVACRLPTAGPYHPGTAFPTRDVRITKHRREFPGSRPIPALPRTCGRHGWDSGPWAFPQAPHPTDQEPATHVAVGTGRTQTQSYVFDIRRTSSTSSLTTCDLVSQQLLRASPPARPRRYSAPRGFCRSGVSRATPDTPAAASGRAFARSEREPRSRSCCLYAGPHLGSTRVSPRLIPRLNGCPGFEVTYEPFDTSTAEGSDTHRSSSRPTPDAVLRRAFSHDAQHDSR